MSVQGRGVYKCTCMHLRKTHVLVCRGLKAYTSGFLSQAPHRLHSCSAIHVLPGAHATNPFITPAPSRHEANLVSAATCNNRFARPPLALCTRATDTARTHARPRPENRRPAALGRGRGGISRDADPPARGRGQSRARRPSGLTTRYAMSGSNYLAISLIIESYATFHARDSRRARTVVAPGSRPRTCPPDCMENTTQCARNSTGYSHTKAIKRGTPFLLSSERGAH